MDTNDNWISLFLAKIQASPSRNRPPGFHGQGRVGVTTYWSPQSSSTREMLALLSCFFFFFSSYDRGVGRVFSPGPPNGKDLSGSGKKITQRVWAGVSRLAFLGRMVPQEVRASAPLPLSPQFWMVSTAELS